MRVTVKLYASLGSYLPKDAKDNQIEIDVPENAPAHAVIRQCGLPERLCHLLLVNGHYIAPEARETHTLKEGDHLAAWPPIAGG